MKVHQGCTWLSGCRQVLIVKTFRLHIGGLIFHPHRPFTKQTVILYIGIRVYKLPGLNICIIDGNTGLLKTLATVLLPLPMPPVRPTLAIYLDLTCVLVHIRQGTGHNYGHYTLGCPADSYPETLGTLKLQYLCGIYNSWEITSDILSNLLSRLWKLAGRRSECLSKSGQSFDADGNWNGFHWSVQPWCRLLPYDGSYLCCWAFQARLPSQSHLQAFQQWGFYIYSRNSINSTQWATYCNRIRQNQYRRPG